MFLHEAIAQRKTSKKVSIKPKSKKPDIVAAHFQAWFEQMFHISDVKFVATKDGAGQSSSYFITFTPPNGREITYGAKIKLWEDLGAIGVQLAKWHVPKASGHGVWMFQNFVDAVLCATNDDGWESTAI